MAETTLVKEGGNPSVYVTDNPSTVTQLQATGYTIRADAAAPAPPGFADLTVEQLKAEIDSRNTDRAEDAQLPKSGSKADLVAVLEGDDE